MISWRHLRKLAWLLACLLAVSGLRAQTSAEEAEAANTRHAPAPVEPPTTPPKQVQLQAQPSAPAASSGQRAADVSAEPGKPASQQGMEGESKAAPETREAEVSRPDVTPPAAPPLGTDVAPVVETVIDAPALRADLWARLRSQYALNSVDSDLVRKWEQYYITRPDYLQRMFERGGRYLFHIVEEVDRRQMPAELALLPFIESAFNPNAVSSARAAGMWQFMPATGRSFDLTQNVFRDDRRSVLESTRAALDYLQQLNTMFSDWHLALAAYNWGQGNVGKALANNRRLGRNTRYEDLSMPDETRNYVPKLQAIANIVARPEQFGLQLPPLENHPYFLSVRVDRDIDVAVAARLAGLPLEEFQALNPQMNKPVILAAGTPLILLPFDNAQRFQIEIHNHAGPFATWTAWVAPATLNPAEVARRVGMSESQLREVNRIPARMLIKAGSTLLVRRHSTLANDVSEQVADSASISLAPEAVPRRRVVVKVGPKGESVAALAQRYRVGAAQLASWNSVSTKGAFKAGQQVVVFVNPTEPVGRAKAASRPATTTPAPRASKPQKVTRPAVRVAAKPAATGKRN